MSEQLPCKSAEVKFFSVFLCQRCREIWREILVKFSVLRFPGFGRGTENFTKISRQKRCEKTENFTQISLCWGAALIFGPFFALILCIACSKMAWARKRAYPQAGKFLIKNCDRFWDCYFGPGSTMKQCCQSFTWKKCCKNRYFKR